MTYRPQHLSVSAVQLYLTCPQQFRARYVERLASPTNPPMAFGIAFHRALEAEHRGEDSERALIAAYNTQQAILDAANLGQMPSKLHALTLLDEYKVRGLGGKMGHPETRFKLMLPSARVPVPVLGFIDLPMPERRRFREHKTTSTQTWTAEKVQAEFQLHVYGWAYQRIFRHRAECAEYVIFGTVEPTVTVIEAAPSPDGLRLFEVAAEGVYRAIERGEYPPCGVCEMCSPRNGKTPDGPTLEFDAPTAGGRTDER